MQTLLGPFFFFLKCSSLLLLIICCCAAATYSQQTVIAGIVKDSLSAEHLPGATVTIAGTDKGTTSNKDGIFLLSNLERMRYVVAVSYVGYRETEIPVDLSSSDSIFIEVFLIPEEIEAEEVVITATRTIRHIADVPVRIEAIPQEEVEEKLLMTPSNVAMLLNESTGMRVQTTSAVSSTANLRIQGLNGRYTQILTDGIPNLGGLSSGFGITQVVPLNLRQVEVIKGASSTLYGSDAISGTVNFITKEPQEHPEVSAILNTTTQNGFDAAVFYARRFDATGVTVMASRNTQQLFDVDDDSFADVAEYKRYTLTPKLIHAFSGNVEGRITAGILSEERTGGTLHTAQSSSSQLPPYREDIKTRKLDLSSQLSWVPDAEKALTVTFAGMTYRRDARYGNSSFIAGQEIYYGDIQHERKLNNHSLLFGSTYTYEQFSDRTTRLYPYQSYKYTNVGIFIQDEIAIDPVWSTLISGRIDFHNRFGTFMIPRASLMYRPSSVLTLRIGGGTGFKSPSIFVEEAEEAGFNNVRLSNAIEAERAISGSFDLNWRTVVDETGVTINLALYLTSLSHALIADDDSLQNNIVFLRNASGITLARGGEISAKFSLADFKLSLGYTYIYATQEDNTSESELSLNPRHSLGAVLFWESEEEHMKVGIENYWTGRQQLDRNPFRSQSPTYWITGIIAEKGFGPLRLFVNFENIFDTRQTRYDPIVIPSSGLTIQKLSIYAPLEGRVVNGGIRFVL